ncbi:unnamed protein product, partial [Brenthis ino]
MKRSLMIHLVEKKCRKTKTLENFEDSPFPPSAELFTEEMSFINTVVNLNNPEDFFEETPTVENLYRNLSNNSSDSDSSTTCFKDQENEGDSIHSVIEKKTRSVLIYTPDQWSLAFKMATDNAKPYIVKEVTQSLIFDFKSCLTFFDNWKKNCIGELVMWNKICEVNVKAKDLFKLNYKYTFEKDAYKTIQCVRSNTLTAIQTVTKKFDSLDVAYKSLLPIDKKIQRSSRSLYFNCNP